MPYTNIRANKMGLDNERYNRKMVGIWMRDNLEALFPKGKEEEKKEEISEEDSTWVRDQVM